MNIIVYLNGIYKYNEKSTEDFCADYYDANCGKDTDGILYLMDLSGVSSPLLIIICTREWSLVI